MICAEAGKEAGGETSQRSRSSVQQEEQHLFFFNLCDRLHSVVNGRLRRVNKTMHGKYQNGGLGR